ncbi:hypothetical protein OnM2_c2332o32 [Erysiphe neolycopersici]|uniref:Uncharacterized protein n=1 Tax=Erysiphe neolycopersici TaxID=212602 RepID=A0A420I0F2_9PEZI|nr:hypothetical protein OnM2_c2332o32 [Erysiphe neolycopersici]
MGLTFFLLSFLDIVIATIRRSDEINDLCGSLGLFLVRKHDFSLVYHSCESLFFFRDILLLHKI